MQKEKSILRKNTHQALMQMSSAEIKLKSILICQKVTQFIEGKYPHRSLNIASFAANSLEPNLSFLHDALDNHRFFYPVCDKNRVLKFFPCTDYNSMRPAKYGILTPDTENQDAINRDLIDITLVPGYSFTHSGSRLGKGGGYYDRYLATKDPVNHISIGICFSNQIVDSIPMDQHDMQLSAIISDISH